MFDFGLGQLLLLGTIALIAIGPKQLPEVAKTLGRFVAELKKYTGEITRQVIEAREATNRSLLQQQNSSATRQASSPPQMSQTSPETASAANAGAPTNDGARDPLPGFLQFLPDHETLQTSFQFHSFIDCFPVSTHPTFGPLAASAALHPYGDPALFDVNTKDDPVVIPRES